MTIDFSQITVVGLDIDDTVTDKNGVVLWPDPAGWIDRIGIQYPHLEWFYGSNQGGAAWQHFNETQMGSHKITALPTPDTIYTRLHALRVGLETLTNKTAWIVTSYAYRFKKPFTLSEKNNVVLERQIAFNDSLLYWPSLHPTIPTRHFIYDNRPKPSGDIVRAGAGIYGESDMTRVLFIGDADGTVFDYYDNPRFEDVNEAKSVGCHFRTPSQLWGNL